VDRGANGGIAGSDTSVISRSGKKIDLCGVDNHTIRNLEIGTAGAVVKTTEGEAILVMHQYALMPDTKTIHSSGQLEHHGNTVQDKSPKFGHGSPVITTVCGHQIPMYIKNGLAYFKQRPFITKEYATLPKIILTSETEWNPSVLDCDEGTFETQDPKDLSLSIMGSEFNYFDGMGRPNDLETGAFMLEIAKLEREGFIREGNDDDLLDECMRMCNIRQ
jgi:hypothetical protein